MRVLRIFITAAGLSACTPASADQPFYGLGQAKDGDSLMVGEREVRLFGIDAPEWDQNCRRNGTDWPCGQAAADQLSKLVTGKQVRCVGLSEDQFGRTLARCTVGQADLNRTMVALGLAVAYRRYSSEYVSAETSAKAARRGLWAGTFEMPDEVRHAAEMQEPAPPRRAPQQGRPGAGRPIATSSGCVIKGNRGSNGWIYHLPGMPYYGRTNAEEIFCSEADAQAAGYKRAKVR